MFKTRAETKAKAKAKVNTALFHLLEIWSVIGVAKIINEDKFSEKLISEIKESYPKENITPEIESDIRNGLEQSMYHDVYLLNCRQRKNNVSFSRS